MESGDLVSLWIYAKSQTQNYHQKKPLLNLFLYNISKTALVTGGY